MRRQNGENGVQASASRRMDSACGAAWWRGVPRRSFRAVACGGESGRCVARGKREKCESAHRVQPVGVQGAAVAGLGRREGPLAAARALGVLPLGLDALLEQVKVRAVDQLARRHDVIVQADFVHAATHTRQHRRGRELARGAGRGEARRGATGGALGLSRRRRVWRRCCALGWRAHHQKSSTVLKVYTGRSVAP